MYVWLIKVEMANKLQKNSNILKQLHNAVGLVKMFNAFPNNIFLSTP